MRAHRPAAAVPAGSADNRILTIAVAGSLLLHLALAAIVVPARLLTAPSEAGTVRIALVPDNPQRRPERDPPAPASAEAVLVPGPDRSLPAESEPGLVPDTAPRLADMPPTPLMSPPSPRLTVPTVVQPDAQRIRESLEQMKQARGSRMYQFDCDERQRRSDLVDCGEEATAHDYGTLESNATYRALNPVREISHSERTVATVTRNAVGLAARLRASAIDPQLQGHLLQELEIGISESANQRQSAETFIRMTDQSAAAQLAREILGDPWIVQRMQELRQRRVTRP